MAHHPQSFRMRPTYISRGGAISSSHAEIMKNKKHDDDSDEEVVKPVTPKKKPVQAKKKPKADPAKEEDLVAEMRKPPTPREIDTKSDKKTELLDFGLVQDSKELDKKEDVKGMPKKEAQPKKKKEKVVPPRIMVDG